MKYAALIFLMAGAVNAQMVDEPTCYSWEGGHKSAGSFSKCGPAWVAPAPKPRAVPAVTTPVVQPPTVIYQTTACPSPEPAKPQVVTRKRPKPAPPCK